MLQSSSEELFLSSSQQEKLVDNLLSDQEPDGESGGGSFSLAKAFFPQEEPPSSPQVPWVCSTRYKTELCSSYSSTDFCKYAEHCQFAHGLHELRVPFMHPKYKTELCRNYHTTGYCYYGLRCLFVHNPSEQRAVVRRRRNFPCRNLHCFGVCPFGSHCLFQHGDQQHPDGEGDSEGKPDPAPSPPPLPPQPLVKDAKGPRPPCRSFSSFGFCLYGTSCVYRHCLPIRPSKQSPRKGPYPNKPIARLPSTSSIASPSPSPSPLPSSPDATAHNAFTFSSQQLSEFLLPLALHLQRLDNTKAQEIWDNRAV